MIQQQHIPHPRKNTVVRHKYLNLLHTVLLLAAMAGLLSLIGWMTAGLAGIKMAMIAGALIFLFSPRVPPHLVMKAYRARPLTHGSAPRLYAILEELSARAGLKTLPRLYVQPVAAPNAFAAGTRDNAAICISEGLLRILDIRETQAILGHEVAHIKNNDMQVMGMAGLFNQVTRFMSVTGQVLILFSIPFFLFGGEGIPILLFLFLVFAPSLSILFNLALSRTREFAADLDSARLTGSPMGLIRALSKIERIHRQSWRQRLVNPYRMAAPSILRTHPLTSDRIARLESLIPESKREQPRIQSSVRRAPARPVILRTPSRRFYFS